MADSGPNHMNRHRMQHESTRDTLKYLFLTLALIFIVTISNAQEYALNDRISLKPNEASQFDTATTIFLDVRTDKEWLNGHIKGAKHLPLRRFKADLESVVTDKNSPVIVYCASGGRAIAASKYMNHLGYKAIPVIEGGFIQMLSAGMTAEK